MSGTLNLGDALVAAANIEQEYAEQQFPGSGVTLQPFSPPLRIATANARRIDVTGVASAGPGTGLVLRVTVGGRRVALDTPMIAFAADNVAQGYVYGALLPTQPIGDEAEVLVVRNAAGASNVRCGIRAV